MSGSTVYLVGYFTTANGATARNNAAAVDATSGTLTAWNPNLNSFVYALAADCGGGGIAAGGSFSSVGFAPRGGLALVEDVANCPGPQFDAGTADAGPSDAGSISGGADGGASDGGLGADAGATSDGGRLAPRTYKVGCDCGTTSGSLAWGVLAAVTLALRRRMWLGAR